MIYIKEKPIEDIFGEFEKRIFKKGLISRGEQFVDVVKSYGQLYQSIFMDKDFIESDKKEYIKYRSLIYIMDSQFSASEWRACVLYYAKKFNDHDFLSFLLRLEKVYLESWTKGVRKDERFNIYSTILKNIEIYDKGSDVIKLIKYNESPIKKAVASKDFYNLRFAKYFLLRLEILSSENDAVKNLMLIL